MVMVKITTVPNRVNPTLITVHFLPLNKLLAMVPHGAIALVWLYLSNPSA